MNELSGSCWVFTALSPSAGSSAYATAESAPVQPGVNMPAKPGVSESTSASAAASASAAVSVRADPKTAPRRTAREAADRTGFDPDANPACVLATTHARILTASPPTSSG